MLPVYSTEVSKYFDPNNLTFKGISKESIVTGQALPEGIYTFCFQAVDYATGQALSADEPQGCSSPINMTYIDPPVLVKPQCGTSVPVGSPQVVTFSWMQPGIAFSSVQYVLTIKEVPQGANPQQIIENQGFPAYAQLTINGGLSTIYGPGEPPLQAGKQYVYRIKAQGLQKKEQFKNQGFSEACTFTVTKPTPVDTTIYLVLTRPSNEQHFNPDSIKKGMLFEWKKPYPLQSDPGQIYYSLKVVEVLQGQTFAEALKKNAPIVDKGVTNTNYISNTYLDLYNPPFKEKKHYSWQVVAFAKGKEIVKSEIREFSVDSDKTPNILPPGAGTIKGVMQYTFADPYGKEGLQLYPYADKNITVVRREYTISGNKRVFLNYADSVIKVMKTASDGSFSTTFNIPPHTPHKVGNIPASQGLFIRVSDPHFTSPDEPIAFAHDSTVNVGNPRARLRSYGLRVTVKDIKPPYVVGEATVYILRNKKMAGVPDNEVSPRPDPPESFFGLEILGKAKADAYGRAEFTRLVECYNDEQYLILVAGPAGMEGYNFGAPFYPTKTIPLNQSTGQLNSEYQWQQKEFAIEPIKITTKVEGTLQGGFANMGHPLQKVPVKLQVRYYNGGSLLPAGFAPNSYPDNGKVVAFATTDNNGHFTFKSEYTPPLGQQGLRFKVVVDEPHFTSPDDDIEYKLGALNNAGTLQANVRKYNLDLGFIKSDTKGAAAGLRVYLLRKSRPQNVPPEEGAPKSEPNKEKLDMEVVAETVTDGSGKAHFTNVVQHAYSNDVNFIYAESDPFAPSSTGKQERYAMAFPAFETWSASNDNATFNNQYLTPTNTWNNLQVYPLPPKIAGRVVRSDNDTVGIANALIMLPDILQKYPYAMVLSDTKGYFEFSSELSAGGAKLLTAVKNGYKDGSMNLPVLKKGEQWYKLVKLDPEATVEGTVTYSAVYSGQQPGGKIKIQMGNGIAKYQGYGYFSLPAPTGVTQKLSFTPLNPAYLNDSLLIMPKTGSNNVGTVTIVGNRHRIRILVKDQETQQPISTYDIMASVEDKDISNLYTDYSHGKGDLASLLEFTAPEGRSSFTIYLRCDPNGNNNFEQRKITIQNKPSKDFQEYTLYTKKAGFVYGHVYLYSKKQQNKLPVAVAHVWKSESSTIDKLECYSNASGEYRLKNVPIGKNHISAGKAKSGTVGTSVTLDVTKNGVQHDIILKEYEDMDITHLLGFPLEVTQLDSTSNGVYLSGSLLDIPTNAQFAAKGNPELPFSNIRIVPHGKLKNANDRAFAKPAQLPLKTVKGSLYLTAGKKISYNAELRPANNGVISVTSNKDTTDGELRGKVFVTGPFTSSISLPISGNAAGFYLAQESTYNTEIIALNSDSTSVNNGKLHIVNNQGGALAYKLYKFDAAADPATSLWDKDSIRLNSKIKIKLNNVQNNPQVELPVGEIIPTLGGLVIGYSSGSFPSIPMDQWTLAGEKWKLKDFSLSIDGRLKTGTIDIPFTDLYVTADGWDVATAKFNNTKLSINNVIPITTTGATQFNYDPMSKYWKLTVVPQPGKEVGNFSLLDISPSPIAIKSLDFYSSGYSNFDLTTGQKITLHKIAEFKPLTVSASTSKPEVEISGATSIGIPESGLYGSNALVVRKENNTPKVSFEKFYKSITITNAKGVNVFLPANKQAFSAQGLVGTGTLKDFHSPSTFTFPVTLYKTVDSTSIIINSNDPTATFAIDKNGVQKLTNVAGSMRIKSGSWDTLRFGGDLTGSNGASGKLSFVARGAIETDGKQNIKVDNISTPFGEATLTYDFAASRMKGSVAFDNSLGAANISGVADFLIDKSGWFFAAFGHVDLQSPNISIQCAMALGGYNGAGSTNEVLSKFSMMQWKDAVPAQLKSYPQEYNDLKGFYFVGDASNFLGFQLPEFNVDLDPVAHASLSPVYGIALSLGMNFAQGSQFDIKGAGYFQVDASFGGSIGIACAGGNMSGGANLYGIGSVNMSSKKWSITGGSDLFLKGSLYVGCGACDSDCDGLFCFTHDFSGSLHYSVFNFNVGTNGFSLSF